MLTYCIMHTLIVLTLEDTSVAPEYLLTACLFVCCRCYGTIIKQQHHSYFLAESGKRVPALST